jgi:hypothetical protein
MASEAAVYINSTIKKSYIIREFYERCGLECVGLIRIPVVNISEFDSLESLVSQMKDRSEWFQVIVTHGDPQKGMLMPLATGGHATGTGGVILPPGQWKAKGGEPSVPELLTGMAQRPTSLNDSDQDVRDVAAAMGVTTDAVQRVAGLLNALGRRKFIVEVRGCNIGSNATLCQQYRRMFGTHMFTAPKCRMFYLSLTAKSPGSWDKMQKLVQTKINSPKKRRRAFEDPSGAMLPIVIDVTDNDGHTNISTQTFKVPPESAFNWATKLLGQWRTAPAGTNTDHFVLQAMWENSELTYHVPMEPGYKEKLVMFT